MTTRYYFHILHDHTHSQYTQTAVAVLLVTARRRLLVLLLPVEETHVRMHARFVVLRFRGTSGRAYVRASHQLCGFPPFSPSRKQTYVRTFGWSFRVTGSQKTDARRTIISSIVWNSILLLVEDTAVRTHARFDVLRFRVINGMGTGKVAVLYGKPQLFSCSLLPSSCSSLLVRGCGYTCHRVWLHLSQGVAIPVTGCSYTCMWCM